MKIGLTGLAGAGKSTLFGALTGIQAHNETAHAAKLGANMGIVPVPDQRVEVLATQNQSKKTTFARVMFVDINASTNQQGQSISQAAQQELKDADALVVVVRGFINTSLANPSPNPAQDWQQFCDELILCDLLPLENRRGRMEKERISSLNLKQEKNWVERAIAHLESGERLIDLPCADDAEQRWRSGFGLLSNKPLLCVINHAEDEQPALSEPFSKQVDLQLCATLEVEIAGLLPEDRPSFLEALGLSQPASKRLITQAWQMLDLISFLTTGEDESRAWPITRGLSARKAAGKIHSDIERGFIRAEVVGYEALILHGNEKTAREKGALRLEGKDYTVQDGDVINFRFNV